MEMLLGQIKAAEELRAPLSICYCKGQYPDMPLQLGVKLIIEAASHATVPIMTILDHGTDFDTCVQAMHYGLSAVMYDGSYLPYEENVSRTREIVQVAHAIGVSVEAELGAVGGSAVEWGKAGEYVSLYTDPKQVVDFVEKTEVDALAISFGNRHGLYGGVPRLNFALVSEIRSVTDVPLVMHGASDLPDEIYPQIPRNGITKVHFWSGPAKLAADNLRDKLTQAGDGADQIGYHHVFQWNTDFFYEISKKYLVLLGAAGKA
jgi:fructose-bisphosphate aldolase class II